MNMMNLKKDSSADAEALKWKQDKELTDFKEKKEKELKDKEQKLNNSKEVISQLENESLTLNSLIQEKTEKIN